MQYPLSQTRGALLQGLITIACSSGFLLFGYDQGVFSGVIVTPYFVDTFNHPESTLLGLVNAIFDIGGALGALSCFLFGNYLGRKKVVFMGCCIATLGAILQATAKGIPQLLVARTYHQP
jgi:MFS family permease